MEYKTKRLFLKISAVALIITGVLNIMSAIFLLISPETELAPIIEVFESIKLDGDFYIKYETLFTFLFVTNIVSYAISIVASFVCSIFYFTRLSLDEDTFYKKKKSFLFITILTLIFAGNVFSFVFALIAFYSNNKIKKVSSQTDDMLTNETIVLIKKIKLLKENGTITQEEYEKYLSEIIK